MEYRPLSSENHEIRLLTLVEGKYSALVTCELKHYSLIDHPPYTALSYCWGNPDITKAIIVNGVKFQATINLEAALRQLQADGYTKMWVDAICINQNDREERSLQVLRMRRIYTEASLVVVWLGIETASSTATLNHIEILTKGKKALKFIQDKGGEDQDEMVKKARARMPPALQRYLDRYVYEPSEQFMDNVGEVLGGFEDEDSRDGFVEFFRRPYWSRVWIIQEIIAASRVVVYCGASCTKLENIEWAMKRTDEGKEFLRTGQVPNFDAFRKSQFSGKASPLVKLLMSSRASLATDPRDKIYGLLGIASDGEELIPLPNYKQPLDFVLEDMTRSMLSLKRCPNILFFRSPDRTPNERLPSWVPDWTELSRMNRPWHASLAGPDGDSAYVGEMVNHFQHLLAPFSRRMTNITRPPIEFNKRILKMRGKIIDHVDGITTHLGTRIERDRPSRRGFVQPLEKRRYYSSDDETARALRSASAWTASTSVPVQEFMAKSHPNILEWLDENSAFSIDGQSFRDWVEAAKVVPIAGGDSDFRYTTASNRPLREYIKRVAQVVGCGMKLATTIDGRVGMLHPQAQRGDVICTMVGCTMPIILRQVNSSFERPGYSSKDEFVIRKINLNEGVYHIVGEAYLHPMKKFTPGYLAENLDLDQLLDFHIQ